MLARRARVRILNEKLLDILLVQYGGSWAETGGLSRTNLFIPRVRNHGLVV